MYDVYMNVYHHTNSNIVELYSFLSTPIELLLGKMLKYYGREGLYCCVELDFKGKLQFKLIEV